MMKLSEKERKNSGDSCSDSLTDSSSTGSDPECGYFLHSDAPKKNKDEHPIFEHSSRTFLPIIEISLAILVILSSLLVGIGTLEWISPEVETALDYGEAFICFIFTVEYIVRWRMHNFSFRYLIKPMSIVDILAIIPGFVKAAAFFGAEMPESILEGALINLRLLRILRLQRALTDHETFHSFAQALGFHSSNVKSYQLQLARVLITVYTLFSVTAGLIYTAEHTVNESLPDYFVSLYFCIITLTTVGFGDISPATSIGKMIISGAILFGSVVIPIQAAALAEALLDRDGHKKNKDISLDETMKTNGALKAEDSPYSPVIMSSRMDLLESKVDETNIRLDKLLSLLEAQTKDSIPDTSEMV